MKIIGSVVIIMLRNPTVGGHVDGKDCFELFKDVHSGALDHWPMLKAGILPQVLFLEDPAQAVSFGTLPRLPSSISLMLYYTGLR